MAPADLAWIMTCSALVLLMTPGLGLFYGGMVSRKNAITTIMHSFVAMGLCSVVWVLWGYSIAFGTSIGGFIGGMDYLALSGLESTDDMLFMIFQCMFAIITPALITGAFAERMKFSAYAVFVVAWVTIVYAPVAHWVWASGGWLFEMGALDFAGGTVVHINSGIGALAAALIIGPRMGFKHAAGVQHDSSEHNIPMILMGAGFLWFGWFGFNAGSALAANEFAVNAFVVTNTAAAMGMVTWLGMALLMGKKPGAVGAASGAIAGLVAITPACGFVGVIPALFIGLGAGVICYLSIELLLKLGVDDALAVWGVHGMGGTWGALATGLFAGVGFAAAGLPGVFSPEYWDQITVQVIGIVVTWIWSFVMTSVILLAIKYTIGLRVTEQEEQEGLDSNQHGESAYNR
jgi:ammonium transporter, Amt family